MKSREEQREIVLKVLTALCKRDTPDKLWDLFLKSFHNSVPDMLNKIAVETFLWDDFHPADFGLDHYDIFVCREMLIQLKEKGTWFLEDFD